MNEKMVMAYQIRKLTLLFCAIMVLISLIFRDKFITGGIAIGALASLIGFNMVVKMAYKVQGLSAGRSARMNYFLRYLMYALIFGISIYCGVNVFALLAGFLCNKVAILFYTRFLADKEVR